MCGAHSLVRGSVTTRVIRVSPLVNSILEDAIYWHLRPEDPEYVLHVE